jgi:hypothetical protein
MQADDRTIDLRHVQAECFDSGPIAIGWGQERKDCWLLEVGIKMLYGRTFFSLPKCMNGGGSKSE